MSSKQEEEDAERDYEQADQFLGRWIANCAPEQLKQAIKTNQDWRVVFENKEFKQDALSSLKSGIKTLDQLTFGLKLGTRLMRYFVRKYGTPDVIMGYLWHMRKSYPAHWTVIWYTNGGKAYVVKAAMEALNALISEKS